MRKPLLLLVLLVGASLCSGCAVAHRYPAYRGRVLELGTDKPIEGAGVLADYSKYQSYLVHAGSRYLGYQAVLTDKEGRFTIPAKRFFTLTPLSWFDNEVFISIYKAGYGNFPGSTNPSQPKHVTTDPPIGTWLPPEKEVTFRLPKLATKEEVLEHEGLFRNFLPLEVIYKKDFPLPGTRMEQFIPGERNPDLLYILKGIPAPSHNPKGETP